MRFITKIRAMKPTMMPAAVADMPCSRKPEHPDRPRRALAPSRA
jgi:hypothetical protein